MTAYRLPLRDDTGRRPAPASGERPAHNCPGGCGRTVPVELFACRRCWYRMPLFLRRWITSTCEQALNTQLAYAQAMASIRAWYEASETGMTTRSGGGAEV